MNKIKMTCPACRKIHLLTLKSEKSVLLLNCPECRTLLLHYGDATYQVEKSEIKDMSRKKNLKSVHALLEQISRQKKDKEKHRVALFHPLKVKSVKSDRTERPGPLSKDEILDLIIDINTSASVTEFLGKIN